MRTKLILALSIAAGAVGAACGSSDTGNTATSQAEAISASCKGSDYYGEQDNSAEFQGCAVDESGFDCSASCGMSCTWDSNVTPYGGNIDSPVCETPCRTTADCIDPATSCQLLPAIPGLGIAPQLSCTLTKCSTLGAVCDASGPGSQNGTCHDYVHNGFPSCSLAGTQEQGESCSVFAFRSQPTELCARGLACVLVDPSTGAGACQPVAGTGGSPPPPPSSPPPSVEFTSNGVTSLTVPVGTSVRYSWSAPGAALASSTYTIDSPACGSDGTGPFPWVADTLSGSTSGRAASCQAGHTYKITYAATSAEGVTASVTDTLYIP